MSHLDADALPPNAVLPAGRKNRVSPKKLLLSKWTAVAPLHKEEHFVVIRVIEPEPPDAPIETVELEAIHSRRTFMLSWRELTDSGRWRQGWV
ncbi:TIGR02450 family Trp-rich protein [Methylibium sp.]|uniref:TIGR02450 family Trp-rich protein n=1 Tax=Methylibium sp. TaxID=2067992 RepID=UPI003D11A18B